MYFDCRQLRATIRPETCAKNWTTSQSLDNGRQQTCRGCQIGAAHAGRPPSTPAAASDEGWRCVHCGPSPDQAPCRRRLLHKLLQPSARVNFLAKREKSTSERCCRGPSPRLVGCHSRPWHRGSADLHQEPHGESGDTWRTVRSKPFNNETSMLQPAPSVFLIGDGRRRLLWAIVETQTELERIARRLLPEYRIDNATLEPSFTEFRLCNMTPRCGCESAHPNDRCPKARSPRLSRPIFGLCFENSELPGRFR